MPAKTSYAEKLLPNHKPIWLTVDVNTRRQVQFLAACEETSMTQWVRDLIHKAIEKAVKQGKLPHQLAD